MTDLDDAQARDVTQLLHRLAAGDKSAEEDLMPRIYGELKQLAAAQLRKERPGHSLQTTALVHEAYLRITNNESMEWKNRMHFFAMAAKIMRRILVDHARRRNAAKRGGPSPRIELTDGLQVTNEQCDLLEDLDEALQRLADMDPRQAQVVELRYFAGLNESQIGELLGISPRTVKRDWAMARAWLYGEMSK